MAASYDAVRDRTVLQVGPVTYCWRDVEALARHIGEWADFERLVRSGIAALDTARRRGRPPSDEAVREAGRRFRRRRRLLSAEDMERWLAERRLTVAEWRNWLRRDVARARRIDEDADVPSPTAQALDAARWVDGVCSGRLRAFADRLAATAAVFDLAADSDDALRRDAAPAPDALAEIYDRVVASAQRPERLHRIVHARQLEWTLISADAVVVASADTAAEIAAGLTDGRPVHELAGLAGTEVTPVEGRLDGTPERLRPHLLSTAPGAVVGPVQTEQGWTVLRVAHRRDASLDEPEVLAAARDAVERQLTSREIDARVIWHDRV